MARWKNRKEIPKKCKDCKNVFPTMGGYDCTTLIVYEDCPY